MHLTRNNECRRWRKFHAQYYTNVWGPFGRKERSDGIFERVAKFRRIFACRMLLYLHEIVVGSSVTFNLSFAEAHRKHELSTGRV